MTIKEAVQKQQEVWLKRLDGKHHAELDCYFCKRTWPKLCTECPVVIALMPKWKPTKRNEETACFDLRSWVSWANAKSHGDNHQEAKLAARAVLEDINRIAKFYHLKQVKIP